MGLKLVIARDKIRFPLQPEQIKNNTKVTRQNRQPLLTIAEEWEETFECPNDLSIENNRVKTEA